MNTIEDVVKNDEYASMPHQIREMFEFLMVLFKPLKKISNHVECYRYSITFLMFRETSSVEIGLCAYSKNDYSIEFKYRNREDEYTVLCRCEGSRFSDRWEAFVVAEVNHLKKIMEL